MARIALALSPCRTCRMYMPNGPYYGFQSPEIGLTTDKLGFISTLESASRRFDSGSFIELTVITSPRMDACW